MTDNDFILAVLADHRPHTLSELLARSINERGHGLTVHSRCADLRAKGYNIRCDRVPGAERGRAFTYRLVGVGSEPLAADGGAVPAGGSDAAPQAGTAHLPPLGEPSPPPQPSLFDHQTKPVWA